MAGVTVMATLVPLLEAGLKPRAMLVLLNSQLTGPKTPTMPLLPLLMPTRVAGRCQLVYHNRV